MLQDQRLDKDFNQIKYINLKFVLYKATVTVLGTRTLVIQSEEFKLRYSEVSCPNIKSFLYWQLLSDNWQSR